MVSRHPDLLGEFVQHTFWKIWARQIVCERIGSPIAVCWYGEGSVNIWKVIYSNLRPVARGGSLGSDEPPLKNHQTIKNESIRVLKEYIALLRPTRHHFLLFRCSIITKCYPERYLIANGLHFVMTSFTIIVTFCTMYSVI